MSSADISEVLAQLKRIQVTLTKTCAKANILHDPSPKLDLESRAGNHVRTIKHLHQMCGLHCRHFVAAGRIKLTHMVDGYLVLGEHQNPVGVFALARTLLEFHVVTAHLSKKLAEIPDNHSDLVTRGQEFFKTIVIARFATKEGKRLHNKLIKAGFPAECLRQPVIVPYVRELSSSHPGIVEYYDLLCEYVHHNLLSNSIAVADLPYGSIARSEREVMLTAQPSRMVTYQYPSKVATRGALKQTASRVLEGLEASLNILDDFPMSPYTQTELRRETGSATGVPFLRSAYGKQPGRNDPCPCGSGLKFKKCHG